ncbi:HAD family hydrolase [Alkalihalobacillus trypoxylicola]|uniref:Haloacid dehalogenase n=1 Tax=Alkalihalobacillus trypoxylicola TaxID=519424 RepID=A0A161Q688_9BACI|nr:HAD family hydrolase [Alkalihalobacillus trypoxylicola]KYG31818.1 haloacid dehalogenase [Alkalihalobacillus trypoxylicola]
MIYRMLALNIDGAIIQSNSKISRQTKAAIDYVKSKGVVVTLVTSKPFLYAAKMAKILKVDGYLVTSDGAFVAKEKDQPFYYQRIEEVQAEEMVDILERYECHIRLYHENYSLGNKMKEKKQLLAKMTLELDEPRFYPLTFVDSVYEKLLEQPMAPLKIQAQFYRENDRELAITQIKKMNQSFLIMKGKNNQLEVMNEGVSKAQSLRMLAQFLEIKLEDMVAVGVSENDIEMIQQAGLGVAMGNASHKVREEADWITRSTEEDGVSYMIKEVFRKQLRVQI